MKTSEKPQFFHCSLPEEDKWSKKGDRPDFESLTKPAGEKEIYSSREGQLGKEVSLPDPRRYYRNNKRKFGLLRIWKARIFRRQRESTLEKITIQYWM